MYAETLNQAVGNATLVLGIIHPAPRPHRLPLGTIVTLARGVQAVITAYSTASVNRYQVSYFDRHFWQVRHFWTDKENFEVRASNETATAA